jgi:hypothetical protein
MAVCYVSSTNAHKIVSLPVVQGIDPISKQVLTSFTILCERCGLRLEEIIKPEKKTRQKRNKPAQPAVVTPTNSQQTFAGQPPAALPLPMTAENLD